MFLLKIAGTSRTAICGNHLEVLLTLSQHIIVIWNYLLGKGVKQKLEIHNITLEQKLLYTDITILLQQIYIAKLASSTLPRHIRQTVTRSRTHTDSIGKTHSPIHQIIQYAARKNATHTSTLEYKTRLCRQ